MAAGGVAPRRIKKIGRAHAMNRDIAMMVGVKSVDPDLSQNDCVNRVAASQLAMCETVFGNSGSTLSSASFDLGTQKRS
jgi:hypothetical protein